MKLNKSIPNVFPPSVYPCKYTGNDSLTQGNWINKYDKDGCMLYPASNLNYVQNSNNIRAL